MGNTFFELKLDKGGFVFGLSGIAIVILLVMFYLSHRARY